MTSTRWLAVVGIGEDGADGLGQAARDLVSGAELVFGADRHLKLAEQLINGHAQSWASPFDTSMKDVLANRGRKVCVLASGDPFMHGVGATLARHVAADEMVVLPAPSAFSLAAARLGWSLPDIETVSLHARPARALRPFLHPGRRLLALTSGPDSPAEIARLLVDDGFGKSMLTVLEAIGGPRERSSAHAADAFPVEPFDALNLVAIEPRANGDARVIPLAPGLDEAMFDHDGQITRSEIRAVSIAALAPRRGQLLWDVGAGSGSVSIEWMLRHPSMRAIAIEADAARAGRISRNAAEMGVDGLDIVRGEAPDAFDGLPRPDAIFVGGGGSDPDLMQAALDALPGGGIIVVNAVTLETEAMLLDLNDSLGGSLTRIALSHAGPVGSMTGWRPAMPVTQWTWRKPGGPPE